MLKRTTFPVHCQAHTGNAIGTVSVAEQTKHILSSSISPPSAFGDCIKCSVWSLFPCQKNEKKFKKIHMVPILWGNVQASTQNLHKSKTLFALQ